MRLPIDQPNSNTNEGAAILSTRQKTDICLFQKLDCRAAAGIDEGDSAGHHITYLCPKSGPAEKGLDLCDDPANASRSQSCVTRESAARLLAHLLPDQEKNREDEQPPNLFGLIGILNLRSNSF